MRCWYVYFLSVHQFLSQLPKAKHIFSLIHFWPPKNCETAEKSFNQLSGMQVLVKINNNHLPVFSIPSQTQGKLFKKFVFEPQTNKCKASSSSDHNASDPTGCSHLDLDFKIIYFHINKCSHMKEIQVRPTLVRTYLNSKTW